MPRHVVRRSASRISKSQPLQRTSRLRCKVGLHRKLGNSCDAADLARYGTFLRSFSTRQVVKPLGSEPRALLTHIAKTSCPALDR